VILIIYSLFGFHFEIIQRHGLAVGYREKPPDFCLVGYYRKMSPHDEGLCMEREANNNGGKSSFPPTTKQRVIYELHGISSNSNIRGNEHESSV